MERSEFIHRANYTYKIMNPSSLLIMIPILIIMITIHHATSAQASLINSTCSAVARADPNVDFAFCQTSLQAAPAASASATLRGLGAISLALLRSNVTDTRRHVRQLTKRGGWDPYTKLCLGDCLRLFSDAIPSAEQALKYYGKRMFEDANVRVSSVMDAATTCEDGFEEGGSGGGASPLAKRNDDVFRLAAVALTVMHMVEKGSG